VTLKALEMFCGAGGMTVGLKAAGFEVLGAIDNEPLAVEAYRANHPEVRVWKGDVAALDPVKLVAEIGIGPGELDLLAGCPPCQGFSTIRTRRKSINVPDKRNRLVAHFARWAELLQPRALMMENVPGLADDIRLRRLVRRLERAGYGVTYGILDAADFGVPQRRARFVLLATLGMTVPFAPVARSRRTVRQAIGRLALPERSTDPLHNHGEIRSTEVRERIAAIPAEGSLRLLGKEHQLECHRRTNGFYDIYGRMAWDEPAPTITGGCINPSKGRFLHPEQNRAITLREAALLQSFPPDYKLPLDRGKYRAAELIGNALPPRFVERHAGQLAKALLDGLDHAAVA
jgi:DNA (cytosine-5)-methyltransferase 1